MLIMEAKPCQHIKEFAEELRALAAFSGSIVLGEFNDLTLEARPGMKLADIVKQWDAAQRESYNR